MKPTRSGYADVNGLRLYHEIDGPGGPLVLIHRHCSTCSSFQKRTWWAIRSTARVRSARLQHPDRVRRLVVVSSPPCEVGLVSRDASRLAHDGFGIWLAALDDFRHWLIRDAA